MGFRNYLNHDFIERTANHLLVLYAFFLTFSKESYEFILSLLIILFLIRGDYKSKIKAALTNKVVLAFFLYFALHVIGMLWTNNVDRGVQYLGHIRYFLIPILFIGFLRYEYIGRIFSAFLLGMLVSEIYSYGLFFDILPPTRWSAPGFPNPFTNHLNYSMLLAFTSMLLLQNIFLDSAAGRMQKILYGIFFVTVTSNLFITGGRSGQIVFLLSVFLMLFLVYRKNFLKIFLIGTLIIGSTLLLAFNFSQSFQKRINYAVYDVQEVLKGDYSNSWGQRVASTMVSLDIIKDRPFLGNGTQGHIAVFRDKLEDDFTEFDGIIHYYKHVHDQYLNVMVQFGAVGLLIMLNIFYQLFRYKQEDKLLKNIQLVLLFMTAIYSFWGRSFEGLIYYIFFISLVTFTLPKKASPSGNQPLPTPEGPVVNYLYYAIIIFIVSKISWLVSVGKSEQINELGHRILNSF